MFQIKSFTTGPSSSQKRQIRNSLERVTQSGLAIDRWVLFLPLDPTPEGLEWFGALTEGYGFECEWHGRARWDALSARYPEVVDYYVGAGRARLERTVKDLSSLLAIREQLDSSSEVQPVQVPELISGLVASMNRSDPHYRYQLHVTDEPPTLKSVSNVPRLVASATQRFDDSWLTVDVIARYDYAVVDRPVPLALTIEPADDESSRAAVERFLDFGAAVELPRGSIAKFSTDLPGGLGTQGIGEGALWSGWIGPAASNPTADGPSEFRFDLRSSLRSHLASVVMRFAPATVGRRGWIRSGEEVGGTFKMTLTGEHGGPLNFQITFAPSEWSGKPIRQIGEPLRFLSLLRPGNQVLIAERYGEPIGDPIEVPLESEPDPEVEGLLNYGSNLAELQRFVQGGLVFPEEITGSEAAQVDELARLLRGERIVSHWKDLRVVMDPDAGSSRLGSGPVRIRVEHQVDRELQGLPLPLGTVAVEFASAKVAHFDDADSGSVVAVLVPEGSDLCEQFIVDPPSLAAHERDASLQAVAEKRRRSKGLAE